MARMEINGTPSTSTDWQNGEAIEKASSYKLEISELSETSLSVYVYFLTGTSELSWDQSYDGVAVTTGAYMTEKGWDGPYTHGTVNEGSFDYSNGAPDGYGYITEMYAIFTNVPSTTKIISAEYYTGNEESGKIYWALGASSEESSQYAAQCFINNEWVKCEVYHFDGNKFSKCKIMHFNGESWVDC